MFYCPNCGTLEVSNKNYPKEDIIFNNLRDGYGLMLHYVLCKKCNYPLSAVVYTRHNDAEEIQYYKSIIEDYQNGYFSDKKTIMERIKSRYIKGNSKNKEQVLTACEST